MDKPPRGESENIAFRKALCQECLDGEAARRREVELCSASVVYWIDAYVWQYNPLKLGREVGPFVTWDFQREALEKVLHCVEVGKSLVIEKSREMGGTYLCLLAFLWFCLFRHDKKFLIISRSAEAVDSPGDPDCIFWKIEHTLNFLPPWMKGRVQRRKMFFGFPGTGSKMTGQASTEKAGVGGRATAVLMDEFSQVREDRQVRQRMASTTSCRIFNGTHLGAHTEFYDLCHDPEVEKVLMHWTQHPDKCHGLYRSGTSGLGYEVLDRQFEYSPKFQFVTDGKPAGGPHPGIRSPWYDQKAKEIGDARGVACDLDIDPRGAVVQIVDPITIRELVGAYCCEPVWRGDISYDRETGEPNGLIKSPAGVVHLWLYPDGQGKPPPDNYYFGVDVSTGQGATNSCLTGITRLGKKVLEVATPFMREEAFGTLAVAVGRLFRNRDGNPALLCWERMGPGSNFGKRVVELGYHPLYQRVETRTGEMSALPGWVPTNDSKRVLIREYFEALYSRQFINPSRMAMEETLDWKYDAQGNVVHGGQIACKDPSGAGANHGDRTVADGIAWMLVRPHYQAGVREEKAAIRQDTLAWRRQRRENVLQEEGKWS